MNAKPCPIAGELWEDDVSLQPVRREDAELLRRWRARDDVRVWFGDTSKISAEAQRSWIEKYLRKDNDAMFIISLRGNESDDCAVGAIALYDIDPGTGTAEYGRVMIGEDKARGRGVAEKASRLLCQWAVEELGLRRIVLWVMAKNHRAIDLYERIGFTKAMPPEARDGHDFMILDAEAVRRTIDA